MSDQTLYIVQSAYQATTNALKRLQQLAQAQDAIIFTGDATLQLDQALAKNLQAKLYLLQAETDLLATAVPDHVQVLSYSEFADLVLSSQRCISIK